MEGPNTDINLKPESDTDADTNQENISRFFRLVIKCTVALIVIVLLIALLVWSGRQKDVTERWHVAVKIVEKDIVTRRDDTIGGEQVYVVIGEDEEGNRHTFEITDEALAGKFDAADAFTQVQIYRYYRFTVGWRDADSMDKDGYYPSIYSARKLLDGFTTESDRWIIE